MTRTDDALRAFIGIRKGSDILERVVREDVRNYNLNLTEFAVLELLFNKGAQPIQHIKARVLIASSSTTYVVDKLSEKGLLQRQRDKVDKRVTYASLTPDGIALMEKIFPQHADQITQAFTCLTDDELKQLGQLLKKLDRNA